ncbi:Malate synthase G [gamma proteobacterium IMCC2047]|nr:Malate synthase G [gamma proteobacterium IMCC2047]
MSNKRIQIGELQVAFPLYQLVSNEIIPGTGVNPNDFWASLEDILTDLAPVNRALLHKRAEIQSKINLWHTEIKGQQDPAAYQKFLTTIGYLLPEIDDFQIATTNVDPEIAQVASPQLVTPIINTRFALNAANARWGSLYNALYGSDVIPFSDGAEITGAYNPQRGEKVIEFAMRFLDDTFPLTIGSHNEAIFYEIKDQRLHIQLCSGETVVLAEETQFIGYQGAPSSPSAILLKHHGLHVELQIDHKHPISIAKDILMEAALTTIQDCEDSVAAVDVEDKIQVYRNWLGLMKGDLSEDIKKGNKVTKRVLNPDREYVTWDSSKLTIPGRSLMLIRNVGHLMTTDVILTKHGEEIPECILDGMITSLIAIHDLKRNGSVTNSRKGSIYIVKPKMHGPEEVEFAVSLFGRIEAALGLERNTIKLGLMDEERRTSLNLKQCIYAAKERLVFINTGFLDRTGDEIHTSMEAGPMVPKNTMKQQAWLQAYESRNVAIGLKCGMKGKAQIGKGMWAEPDNMAQMLDTKISHLQAGASCAWVPSPTAAVLHALHYHKVNLAQRQEELINTRPNGIEQMLALPLLEKSEKLTEKQIQNEVDNNIQGILGYVVRWVNQGIGCSKIPDINNVGLMEDRATLRISSQHIANWLHHGICSAEQVMNSLKNMAAIVDAQNADTPNYRPMTNNFKSNPAFTAAYDLIFKGKDQPNGYTEPVLHNKRKALKNSQREAQNTVSLFHKVRRYYPSLRPAS